MTYRAPSLPGLADHTAPERHRPADACPACGATLCRCQARGIEALRLIADAPTVFDTEPPAAPEVEPDDAETCSDDAHPREQWPPNEAPGPDDDDDQDEPAGPGPLARINARLDAQRAASAARMAERARIDRETDPRGRHAMNARRAQLPPLPPEVAETWTDCRNPDLPPHPAPRADGYDAAAWWADTSRDTTAPPFPGRGEPDTAPTLDLDTDRCPRHTIDGAPCPEPPRYVAVSVSDWHDPDAPGWASLDDPPTGRYAARARCCRDHARELAAAWLPTYPDASTSATWIELPADYHERGHELAADDDAEDQADAETRDAAAHSLSLF